MNLKHLWGAALAALFFIAPVSTAQAYVVNTDYELGTYEGDSRLAYHNIIIAHETGNPNNTGYLYEEPLLRRLHALYCGK